MTAINPFTFLGSSSKSTPGTGVTIEGPPNVNISITPKDAGNNCSRYQNIVFTWSEPTNFLNTLLFINPGNLRSIIARTVLPIREPGNTVFVFSDDVSVSEWTSTAIYKDKYDDQILNSARKGDVARRVEGNWLNQGNIQDIPGIATLDQVEGTPNNISIVNAPLTASGVNSNDIQIFDGNVSNLPSYYEDITGSTLTDAARGDIFQFGGSSWNKRGSIGNRPFYLPNDEDRIGTGKIEFIHGTVQSDNNLIWIIEALITDSNNKGSIVIGVFPETGYGRLSKERGPSQSAIISDRSRRLTYDFSQCKYPEVDIIIDEDEDQDPDDDNNDTIRRQSKYQVIFIWDEDVENFDSNDEGFDSDNVKVTDENGHLPEGLSISAPSMINGDAKVYSSILTLPVVNTNSIAKITVKANSVTGVSNTGPVSDTSESITYNNSGGTCQVTDAATSIGGTLVQNSIELEIEDNPYLNDVVNYEGNNAGGIFNGILESIRIGRYQFVLVQIMKQMSGVLRASEQAGAAILRFDRTTSSWQLIKSYSDVTIAARSFKYLNNYLHFFEGSHYAYLPDAVFTNNDLTVPTRIKLLDFVRVKEIVEGSLPGNFGDTSFGIFSIDFAKPTYNKIQQSASLMNTKINQAIERNLPYTTVRVKLTQKIAEFMDPNKDGGEPTVEELIRFVEDLLRPFTINSDSIEWKSKIGKLSKLPISQNIVAPRKFRLSQGSNNIYESIAISQNEIFVANSEQTRISVYSIDTNTASVDTLNANTPVGSEISNRRIDFPDLVRDSASFIIIGGMAISGNQLFAASSDEDLIYVFNTSDREVIRSFGLDSSVVTGSEAVSGLAVSGDELFILNKNDRRIYIIPVSTTEDSTRPIRSFILPPSISNPGGITIYRNELFVIDRRTDTVYVVNSNTTDGTVLKNSNIIRQISLPSQIDTAQGITIHDGKLYVVDSRTFYNLDSVFIVDAEIPPSVNPVSDVWRSATTEDNPDHDNDNPDYYYGVHGGTASPIFVDGDNLHLITGYGNLRQGLIRNFTIDQVNNPINHIDNWNWIQYSNKLNHKVPLLSTNERSPYDILNDIAKMTNSIFGINDDKFFIKPREPRKAKLSIGISDSQIGTIGLSSGSHNWTPSSYPESGLILIDSELITYQDIQNNYLSLRGHADRGDIDRGVHGTTASSHSTDSQVLWIDHFISLKQQVLQGTIQKLNTVSQSEHLYNHIKVSYGEDETYETEDEDSINDNGRKTLEIDVPLIDSHQLEWAKWIGDNYLQRFKDLHHIIDLQLPTTLYMNLGDIALIEQEDRAFMFTPCQVLDINQNPSEQTTTIKLVTV